MQRVPGWWWNPFIRRREQLNCAHSLRPWLVPPSAQISLNVLLVAQEFHLFVSCLAKGMSASREFDLDFGFL